VNINKFLAGTADFLQRTLGEQIEVQVVGSAGLWTVEVDADHLESALVNLAINARDAMPGGGTLTIEAENIVVDAEYQRVNPEVAPGQYVLICVSDTGSGMSSEVSGRAFEPFFTTKEPGQGTGLGLSQVYGFVKQSGGHVKIYSELGLGTTIKIYLPRLTGTAPDDDREEESEVEAGIQGETILLVEDDDELRAYLAEIMRNLNYRVFTAASAQAALTSVLQADRRIDLLLTDIVMPGLNGRELARRAQEIRPDLKVLYMTGYSRNAVVHQGRLEENVELIQKPFTQAQIALRVRSLLDQRA
jgi:CheY-like chemotaxis protein